MDYISTISQERRAGAKKVLDANFGLKVALDGAIFALFGSHCYGRRWSDDDNCANFYQDDIIRVEMYRMSGKIVIYAALDERICTPVLHFLPSCPREHMFQRHRVWEGRLKKLALMSGTLGRVG